MVTKPIRQVENVQNWLSTTRLCQSFLHILSYQPSVHLNHACSASALANCHELLFNPALPDRFRHDSQVDISADYWPLFEPGPCSRLDDVWEYRVQGGDPVERDRVKEIVRRQWQLVLRILWLHHA